MDQTFRLEHLFTPTGTMLVVTDDAGVLRAADWQTHAERMHELLRRHYGAGVKLQERSGEPSKAKTALASYFAGDLAAIDTIATATGGTAFQRDVWLALRTIPAGKTLSYSGLAQRIGREKAVRAVGLANGANPIAIVVPCHRVIGASGALTGYGGGIERKTWLLQHEKAALDEAPVANPR
jgi:methylated-DNA-[protein]-cysteine S-methyltransferase